jgi:type II secretory pathway component PulF
MPTFEYQAIDGSGTSVNGSAVGANLETVLSDLGRRGFTVERINVAKVLNDPLADVAHIPPRPTQAPSAARLETPRSEQPSSYQQAYVPSGPRSYIQTNVVGPIVAKAALPAVGFFFRQLGTMLKAGVPIVQSLETLADQARDIRLKPIINDVRDFVKAGHPISEGLARHPETVSPVMLSLVRVGEEAGFLDEALSQISDYIDREIKLRNMYKRATFYPKLVLASSFIIIAVCNTIIASVAPGQKGLSSPLSLLTWLFLGGAGLGIWLFLRIGLQNPNIKSNFDQFVLRIPVLGFTMHQLAMAKFGRAFGAMYKAGVPLNKSLPLAADACGNEYLRRRMYPSFRMVGEGRGIYETLASSGAFSRIVLDMVSTGEKTGNMEQMVTKVSEYYESEAETRQNALAMVTGVVIFLIVALYVGYMVVTFYSGLYSGVSQAGSDSGMLLWPILGLQY